MVFTKAKTLIALFIFFFIQMAYACCNLFTTGVSEECHVDEFKKKILLDFYGFFYST